jgi:hypothetical protein
MREVHVDLGARPARPRVRHLPEVVLRAQPVDPLVGKSGDLAPERARLVVLVKDRHAQVLAWIASSSVTNSHANRIASRLK